MHPRTRPLQTNERPCIDARPNANLPFCFTDASSSGEDLTLPLPTWNLYLRGPPHSIRRSVSKRVLKVLHCNAVAQPCKGDKTGALG